MVKLEKVLAVAYFLALHRVAYIVDSLGHFDNDAEARRRAAQRPPEVRVLGFGGGHDGAVGKDHAHRDNVVDAVTDKALQPADADSEVRAG